MKKNIISALVPALAILIFLGTVSACSAGVSEEPAELSKNTADNSSIEFTENIADDSLKPIRKMELEYAEMFSVDYLEKGLSLITIENEPDRFLIVPKDETPPENLPDDIVILQQPIDKIYLAASALMDLFSEIDALDSILSTSTMEKDWSLPIVKEYMKNGSILYVGKYSAPDMELIVSEGSKLAIESTMIYHSPEIKEQLEHRKIPVLVERSSYESHPLGRMEWIKLCGLLIGKERQAEDLFNQKTAILKEIVSEENTGKTAAFFYISSNGYVNVRKPGDYISKMLELAGGRYIFTAEDLKVEDNSLSTMNMQFEAFYAKAKDADYLIYNSTTVGGMESIEELIETNKLFREFKAVKNGNVWCTNKNFYQQTSAAADMIADFHKIFSGSETETPLVEKPEFLYHLE